MTAELEAKIKLLDDPDETIYFAVRKSLILEGMEVIPVLEEAWGNLLNPMIQERIEEIIKTIQFSDVQEELNQWKLSGGKDLAYGAFIISKYLYADLTWENIDQKIEAIKKDVWLELNNNITALEKIRLLNHIIFEVHGFTPNTSTITSPQTNFINNVLETKKGNTISLAVLYISIAQRLQLPIFGVDLPKNFIACYIDQISAYEAFGDSIDNTVLFYINPFNRGGVFGRKEIDYYIQQAKLEPQPSYFSPCTNIKVIERLISNLLITYEQLGYTEKANELSSLLKIVI
jgi:regulator of sirC expression with transglutaminase-like and TPR domain